MNKTTKEAKEFFASLNLDKAEGVRVVVCLPFTALGSVRGVCLGAQNIHHEAGGAFTGEISGAMLRDAGVEYVLVGHSERRTYNNETDELVAKKIKAALESGIVPVLCIGESLTERESGKTNDVLARQLGSIPSEGEIIVAYEPVWAIGTGLVASTQQIRDTHAFIRSVVDFPILYGGSANEKNASEILAIENVDGLLVGGASLCPEKFKLITTLVE